MEPDMWYYYGNELVHARGEAEDLDLAFRLQMEEAMAASLGHSVPSGNSRRARAQKRAFRVEEDGDNAAARFQFQQAELYKNGQALQDRATAAAQAEHFKSDLHVRLHDQHFARSLLDIPDDEWHEEGDLYEKPYQSSSVSEQASLCSLFFDGAARGNPGHGGAGGVLKSVEGAILWTGKRYLGESVTNNVAEYCALVDGLEAACALGVESIRAYGDSNLVVQQVNGRWQARDRKLIPLLQKVHQLRGKFTSFSLQRLARAQNSEADVLANASIDEYLLRWQSEGAGSERTSVLSSCGICLEDVSVGELVRLKGCPHAFCRACLSKHVEVKVKERSIPHCPQVDCQITISSVECKNYVPEQVFNLFTKLEAEASIPEDQKVYCPFPTCSALMILSADQLQQAGSSSHPHATAVGAARCHECMQWFCVECQVPWHADMSCADYQALPADMRGSQDMKLYQLAEKKQWKRCGKCRLMIELESGCNHMTCRCGHEFCYKCGAEWKNAKATCGCVLWDEENIIEEAARHEPRPLFHGFKTRICRYWLRGTCRRDAMCPFAHGEEELRR